MVPSVYADTAFRAECIAPGSPGEFVIDPRVFSLPDQVEEFRSWASICFAAGGHLQVDGNFFERR